MTLGLLAHVHLKTYSSSRYAVLLWQKEGGGLRADVYDMYYDIQVVRTMSELEDAVESMS